VPLAFAVAWALPVVAYLTGLAVVVPVVVLVATASLLRGGRTLLDRFMLAIALLTGLTCGFALIFAVWPWGMHPVPVGGFALSGLVALAWLTGRRPVLPRPAISDGVTVAAAGAVGAFIAIPLLRVSDVGRLAVVLAGEDMSRHLSLFDAIRHTGGYAFQDSDAAAALAYEGMITYPQGQHMLAALLDNFVRSAPDAYDTGLAAMNHYLGYHALGYTLFTLAMLWAVQWIAGGLLSPVRRTALVGGIAALCLASDLLSNVSFGYPSAVLGLTEMVLLVAVLTRGVARTRQQMVTVASLVVAVGFTYYLFLPAAALAVLFWLVRNRHRVLRHRVAALVTAVVAGPLAVLPLLIGLTVGRQSEALLRGGALRPSRDLLLAVFGIVVGSVLLTRARRSPLWRGYLWSLGAACVLSGTLIGVQAVYGGGDGYYPNKSLHLVAVVLFIGLGAVLHHLPPPRRHPESWRAWRRAVLPAAFLVVVIAAAFGLVRGDSPYRPRANGTWARVWWSGQQRNAVDAQVINRLLAEHPPDGSVAVFVLADQPYRSYMQTLFLATFQRTSGRIAPGLYITDPIDAPDRLEKQILRVADPVRILVTYDGGMALAEDIKRRHPERRIDVVRAG
jgi:hypothetical protein